MLHRGQVFFDRVYGKVAKRVMGQMDGCGTEDLGLVARLLYGYVLSCEGVLSGVETSWVLLAGLIPQDVSLSVEFEGKELMGGVGDRSIRSLRGI